MNEIREARFFKTWNYSFIPMNIREFSFKFLNNRLILNANRAKMLNNPDLAPCTFCAVQNIIDPEKEKIGHLFKDCNFVRPILRDYFAIFFGTPYVWNKKWQLIGAPSNFTSAEALLINVEIITVNAYIFNCKRLGTLPNLEDLKYHVNYYRDIYSYSSTYKKFWTSWLTGVQAL